MRAERMTREQCAAWLNCTVETVDELIKAGMPESQGTFDPYAIAAWMEKAGLARRENFKGVVPTLAEVARVFGVALQTVKNDWRSSGMPGRPKHWDLAEIAAWKQLREKDTDLLSAPGGSGELPNGGLGNSAAAPGGNALELARRRFAADARKKEADAQKAERENREAESNTLEKSDVDRAIGELIIATREAFKSVARTIMPRLPKRHARELSEEIDREIDRILTQMSQWRPRWGREDEAADDD